MFADSVAFDSVAPARHRAEVMRAKLRKFGELLLVTMALSSASRAQSAPSRPLPVDYFAKSWLVEDGLPHNVVNRIVQDGRGFLWARLRAVSPGSTVRSSRNILCRWRPPRRD